MLRTGGNAKETAGRILGVVEWDQIALLSARGGGGDFTIITLLSSQTAEETPPVGGEQRRRSANGERDKKDARMESRIERRRKNR